MGSLVPGWNAVPGVPPKELQEFSEVEQASGGYFARLEQSKSLRRSSVDPGGVAIPTLQPIPSLQRNSSGQRTLSSSLGNTSLTRASHPSAGAHAPAAASHHHLNPVGSPHKYEMTDWGAELKSLSSKRGAMSATLSGHGPGADQSDSARSSAEHHVYGSPTATTGRASAGGGPSWWSHLDSGALNRNAVAEAEAAVAAVTPKDLRGSFKLDVPTGLNLH